MNSNFDQETIFIALCNAKSFEVLTYSARKIHYYAVDFLGAQFYLLVKKLAHKSKSICTFDWETTRNIHFCSLSPKYDLQLSLSLYFHQTFLQWSSCSVNVVWLSKIRCVSKKNSHTSDASVKRRSATNALITICRKISQ